MLAMAALNPSAVTCRDDLLASISPITVALTNLNQQDLGNRRLPISRSVEFIPVDESIFKNWGAFVAPCALGSSCLRWLESQK
jgi:hypothetical protein